MNEIATTTKQGLTVQQNSNPLIDLPVFKEKKEDVFYAIQVSVARVMADLNHKEINEIDLDYLINELTQNVIKKYPSIRLQEINEAFSRGIRKEYGEYYGLSVITFENFLKGYIDSEHRKQLFKSLPDPFQSVEPSDEEKFEYAKTNALYAFQKFNEQKDFSVSAPAVYNFLDALKLIEFSNQDKHEFISLAQTSLTDSLNSQKAITKDKFFRQHISNMLDRINQGMEKEKVIIEAKRLCVNACFQDISLNNNDLQVLIEDRKDLYIQSLKRP